MTNATTALSAVPEPDSSTEGVDGRKLRRKRNRDAVISALITLIEEGDLEPTVAKIADRASVSHRSIFRYFDDLNDLARTAIETAVRQAMPLGVIPNVGEGPLDHRVDAMIASRMRLLLRTKQLIRVAHGKSTALPELDRGLANIAEMTKDQMSRHFAREFDAMDPVTAEHALMTLSALAGFEGYDHQSRLLGRTDDEITDSWRMAFHRLLA